MRITKVNHRRHFYKYFDGLGSMALQRWEHGAPAVGAGVGFVEAIYASRRFGFQR